MRPGCGHNLFAAVLTFTLEGCFSTKPLKIEELQQMDRTVAVQITPRHGATFRAQVTPGDLGPATLRYQPLRYGPASWVVRFGGWPIVYTAGKYLRFEPEGDRLEIPLGEVERLRMETSSPWLTFLTLPLTLPVGVVDFLVHHIRFGFDDVDTRFDSFARQPPPRRPL
jgi:hypothetical protein